MINCGEAFFTVFLEPLVAKLH